MENFGSWSVLTTNFLYTLYIALNGVTLAALLHLANGKWRFEVRKVAVATSALFPLVFVLLIIILANGEHTFVWMAEQAHGGGGEHGEGHHLNAWHNYNFLVARQFIGFMIIAGLWTLFIKYQHESEIDASYAAQRRFRNVALLIPFFYPVYGTMVAWDFEMTQMAGWHSASYGFYHFQSNFHMYLAFITVLLYFLNKAGVLKKAIPSYIFNYFAQFMLGMTILWTYLYFTQYLIMWYGRLPDEMIRFDNMMQHGLAPIWWLFLTLKFIIPFCTLAITPNRHNPPVIVFVALSILLGSWIERYTWVSGSSDPAYYHIPMTSIVDIGVTALVFGTAWFLIRMRLRRDGLVKTSEA